MYASIPTVCTSIRTVSAKAGPLRHASVRIGSSRWGLPFGVAFTNATRKKLPSRGEAIPDSNRTEAKSRSLYWAMSPNWVRLRDQSLQLPQLRRCALGDDSGETVEIQV